MNVLHVKGPTSVWLFIAFQYFVFMIMFVSERIVDDVPLEVWRAHSVIIYFRSWKYCFTTINTVNFICMCVYSDGCFIFKPAFAGMFVYVCVYVWNCSPNKGH